MIVPLVLTRPSSDMRARSYADLMGKRQCVLVQVEATSHVGVSDVCGESRSLIGKIEAPEVCDAQHVVLPTPVPVGPHLVSGKNANSHNKVPLAAR